MKTVISEDLLLQKVSHESLMNFTQNIASEVRLSGSEEEWRAFLYAKETLHGFGLETKLYKRKAFISLPISAELIIEGLKYDSITHSMAKSTTEDGINGDLIYLGSGTDAEYESSDPSGKIILLDGLAIPGAVKKAESQGALGVVFINADYTHEMIVSTVWGNPTLEKINDYPGIPVVSVNFGDGLKIKQQLEGKLSIPVWFKTKVDTGWRDIPTLEAEIKGEQQPEQFVLFSGHIDSWHLGVMDNGTANATMLEVARILSANVPLRRSLRFVFWSGHSHGRYAGSAMYCDEHWEELYDSCVLHINIDSVGGKNSVVLSEGNCMAETKNLAASVIQDQTGEIYEGSRFGRAGDQSFWGPGVPSLFMGLSEQEPATTPASEAFSKLFGSGKGGGFGWWWHTTEDTLDKIDPEFLARDAKIYLSTIYQACTREILPLDQRAAVEELKQHLLGYQEVCPDLLGSTVERVEKLREKVQEVYQLVETTPLSEVQIEKVNNWIMQISRGLVRLNYVGKDEFDHDLALGQPAVPLLADIHKLKEMEKDEANYFALQTTLRRKVNKVNFILRKLIEETDEVIL
jgi:hypothetical protein